MSVSVPARMPSISLCGVPRQRRPDKRTLVSMTARTLPTLSADRLHFRIDLFHGYRLDAGLGHSIGYGKERVRCLLAPDGVGEQPVERLRRQQSCLTCGLRGRVGEFDLNLRHGAVLMAHSVGPSQRYGAASRALEYLRVYLGHLVSF